ncbi:MAG: NUDIX hydrolase [Nanoarchaeota archaeon]|nr:NUDIX hydrolase [Nanoarchaeota archaeon]
MVEFKDSEGVKYEFTSSSMYRVRLSAYAIIENEDKKICIIRTQKTKDKWEFAGGGCEFLEELDECVKREVKEELGFEILVLKSPFFHSINHCYFRSTQEFIKKVDFYYKTQLINDSKYIPEQVGNEVIKEIKWISISELKEYEFMWTFKGVVEYLELYN